MKKDNRANRPLVSPFNPMEHFLVFIGRAFKAAHSWFQRNSLPPPSIVYFAFCRLAMTLALCAVAPQAEAEEQITPPIILLQSEHGFMVSPGPTTYIVPFTVSDAKTPLEELKLSGRSSNQEMIPDSAISFGGSGGQRTLIYMPVPRRGGPVFISVTVENLHGARATASIYITGIFCNAPPVISPFQNRTLLENRSSGLIPFFVDDCNSLPEELNVYATSSNEALIPVGRIKLGGEGTERTVEFCPLPSTQGSSTITLILRSGEGLAAVTRFTVAVLPQTGPPFPDRLFVSTIKNQPQAVDLRGTFLEDAPLAYAIVANPTHGGLLGEPPDLVYVPDPDVAGLDSFSFTISDGVSEPVMANVKIEITETPMIRFLPSSWMVAAQPRFGLAAPSGHVYVIEHSRNLVSWEPLLVWTNTSGYLPLALSREWQLRDFFRAKLRE